MGGAWRALCPAQAWTHKNSSSLSSPRPTLPPWKVLSPPATITSEELFEINLGTDEKEELKMKDEIDYKDEMTTESSKVILRQHLEELENFVESVDNKSEDGFEDFMESIKNLKVESEKNKDKIKNEASRINNEYRNNLKEIENKIEAIIKAL